MAAHASSSSLRRILRNVAVGAVFTAVVIVLLLGLAGVFHAKIGAARGQTATTVRLVGNTPLAEAHLIRTPAVESAVGTVQAVHEVALASKLLAKVAAVNVQAGQEVQQGEVLVRLDDADLQARLRQAEATVTAARAARDQAQIEFDRTKNLHEQGNATALEFERDQTKLKSTEAEVDRAEQARSEAETVLGYATVRSPLTGKVVDKRVEAGDTVTPGQTLVKLFDPTHMQLVATVRESLSERLKVGENIGVQVDALGLTCTGRVAEIVPEAQSASRTFQVKVTGPCPPGIYSGMFGRLLIPLDEQEVLVIPRAAVRRIGQLNIVDVAEQAGPQEVLSRRAVELGRPFGEDVEVLAGLRAGERVALRDS